MSVDERSGGLPPDVREKERQVAEFLAKGIAKHEVESAAVRERFDQGRYADAVLSSAAATGEKLVHEPEEVADFVDAAAKAIDEAATIVAAAEHHRYLDAEA